MGSSNRSTATMAMAAAGEDLVMSMVLGDDLPGTNLQLDGTWPNGTDVFFTRVRPLRTSGRPELVRRPPRSALQRLHLLDATVREAQLELDPVGRII